MANLRTNNLSGEQGQNAYRGSVFFNATPNAGLQMLSSDFAFGTGDFTVEGWFWYSGDGATIASIFDSRTTDTNTNGFFVGVNASGKFYTYGFRAGTGESAHNTIPPNSGWNHFAIVRSGNDGFRFLNGQQVGATEDMSSTNYTESGGTVGQPSNVFSSALYRWKGYLSNIRVHKGEAIYTSNFTPPTTELKATSSNCVLLCCQDSDDPTQDATGKTITAQNLISGQPKVIPPFGVDAGNAFGGTIQQSTQGYMHFPTGRTEERGRGRVIVFGKSTVNGFFEMSTGGIGNVFGSANFTVQGQYASCSSTTRAVRLNGYSPSTAPIACNVMEFVTIATQSNATDFGDSTRACRYNTGFGSQTRGINANGNTPGAEEIIDFITIATTGDATDFGDLQQIDKTLAGSTSNSTRGLINGCEPGTNITEFVTIATTGNAQDFGDSTVAQEGRKGAASSTRAIFASGYSHPTFQTVNTIDFFTIATTGNATDFGDMTYTSGASGGTSNSVRAVIMGGYTTPGNTTDTIDIVTIATTGDAVEFGDLHESQSTTDAATSDCHAGLS